MRRCTDIFFTPSYLGDLCIYHMLRPNLWQFSGIEILEMVGSSTYHPNDIMFVCFIIMLLYYV